MNLPDGWHEIAAEPTFEGLTCKWFAMVKDGAAVAVEPVGPGLRTADQSGLYTVFSPSFELSFKREQELKWNRTAESFLPDSVNEWEGDLELL